MLDRRNAFVAAAVIAALCLPLLVKDYYLFQATMTLIMAIALLGLNVLVGYSGQVSTARFSPWARTRQRS